MKSRLMLATVLLLTGILGACQGCPTPLVNDLVTITYRQVGNFNQWNLLDQSGSINDGVFLRYKIISIRNTDSSPKLFHFDPAKIYASDPSEKPAPFIFLASALAFDVSPGQVFAQNPPNPGLTIRIKGNPAELLTQVMFLNYASGPGEHVLMASDNPNATSVPNLNILTNTGS